jgi:hypothetical protein
MAENKLPEGIRLFAPHQYAPDFVIASLVITLDDLYKFTKENPDMCGEYQGKKQLKLQIKRSRDGKLYSDVDTYGTAAHQAPPERSTGGYSAAMPNEAPDLPDDPSLPF